MYIPCIALNQSTPTQRDILATMEMCSRGDTLS